MLVIYSKVASAQIQIQNGGMELWSGFNHIRPDNWSTTEQAFGVHANKWVFRDTRPDNLHGGAASVRLFSDTIIAPYGNKPSQTSLWPGMIGYGRTTFVNGKVQTSGLPVYGRPVTFSFYIKLYHPQPDTASVRLLLTRWNPIRRKADTLAYNKFDVFADSTIMQGFALFIDTINYIADGQADTARIIIAGGRPGNIRLLGNMAWVDDISFNYSREQIVHPDIDDEVFLYPNPATTKINIQADAQLAGYKVIFMDLAGIKVKETAIDEGTTTVDVTDMHDGSYCYAVLNRDLLTVHEGNINIMKNRP